jgi:hypothetical protein
LLSAATVIALLAGATQPAAAKDVRLGGTSSVPGAPVQPPPKLAPNIVELPTIVVAIRKDDGGWHHVRIDAWLAPKDIATAQDMDDRKASIVRKSKETLPGARGFDVLKSAHDGNQVAKDVIHTAAERSIGRPWTGDVLIRNMVVY